MTLECPRIVLFTSAEMAPAITALRPAHLPALHVVVVEFGELEAWKLWQDVWKAHHKLDAENFRHTPELYAVWAQKPFFLARAASMNVFDTEWFMWNDIGTFRDGGIPENVRKTYPQALHLQQDSLLMTAVESLRPSDWVLHPDDIRGDFRHPAVRNVGGLFGGGKVACDRWLHAYTAMLGKYFEAGRFAGKDQSVMLSAYLHDPSLATFVTCTDGADPWFFITRLCAKAGPRYEADVSYTG